MNIADRYPRVKYRKTENGAELEGWLYQIVYTGTVWGTIIINDDGTFALSRMPWTRAIT